MHPSYIDLLKQLTPDDASLLDKICDWCERNKTRKIMSRYSYGGNRNEIERIINEGGDSFENLFRLGLIETDYGLKQPWDRPNQELDSWYELSDFARWFVDVCRAPQPAQKAE